MNRGLGLAVSTALMLGLSACGDHKKPTFTFMPDMAYSPAYKAQEKGAMRLPVEGTVPRGYEKYPYPDSPERAGRNLTNPLARTRDVLELGREKFDVFCAVCHGPQGQGDGSIVPKFPRPPSLTSAKVNDWSDGRIFHVITMGQNLMPAYRYQVEEEERWAIVHYLRVLYRAQNPTASDLKRAENW